MRMYLSSFRLGDHPEQLLELLGGAGVRSEIAVIANALDGQPEDARKAAVTALDASRNHRHSLFGELVDGGVVAVQPASVRGQDLQRAKATPLPTVDQL